MHKQKFGVCENYFFSKVTKMRSIIIRPQNRLSWGRGSERPAVHTKQKLTQVNPRGGWSHKKVWLFLPCLSGLPPQPQMLGEGGGGDRLEPIHAFPDFNKTSSQYTNPSHISMNKLFYLNWFLIMCLKFLIWKCIWYSQQQMEFRMHQLDKWTMIWSKFKKKRDENWAVLRKRPGEKFLWL